MSEGVANTELHALITRIEAGNSNSNDTAQQQQRKNQVGDREGWRITLIGLFCQGILPEGSPTPCRYGNEATIPHRSSTSTGLFPCKIGKGSQKKGQEVFLGVWGSWRYTRQLHVIG